MNRILALLLLVALAPVLAASTTITADVVADTTWNNAGSPYILDPSGASGGVIKVKSGKTLTIDSAGGAVEIQWNEDCDFQVGNGSGDAGDLVINASGGTVTFTIMSGGNVIINSHGAINFSNTTYSCILTRFSSEKGDSTPGALIFDAGQTKQSALKNCDFSYMGNDSQDGALYIKSSATYLPTLEDITFDNCTTSAIRMDGNGINLLKKGNVKLPLSVTNTTNVLYLSAVTSTSGEITFPDPTSPDAPVFKLTGTNQVGDSSNVSHWRFLDDCTFKCSASSTIQVVRGSIWGSSEARPTFQSDSGSPGYTDWVGLEDSQIDYANIFGDMGPFAYLSVRDASYGINFSRYGGSSPITGKTLRLPGLEARHCSRGIYIRTKDGRVVVENAIVGGPTSGDYCSLIGINCRPDRVHCVDN